jgi:hypothetical protein
MPVFAEEIYDEAIVYQYCGLDLPTSNPQETKGQVEPAIPIQGIAGRQGAKANAVLTASGWTRHKIPYPRNLIWGIKILE